MTSLSTPNHALRVLMLKLLTSQELWVGLITEFPGQEVSLEHLESLELQEPGYERQPIVSGAWEQSDVPTVALAEAFFHNAGPATWRHIAAMFLTNTRGASGVVIAVMPMRFGNYDLPPGGNLHIPITLEMAI